MLTKLWLYQVQMLKFALNVIFFVYCVVAIKLKRYLCICFEPTIQPSQANNNNDIIWKSVLDL